MAIDKSLNIFHTFHFGYVYIEASHLANIIAE